MNPGKITQQTRRLARNVKWLSLKELMIRLIGLATAIYLARVLSPAAYGSLGLAIALIGVLGTLVQAGTGSRATRLTALDPGAIPRIYAETTGLRIAIVLLVLVALALSIPGLSSALSVPPGLLYLYAFVLLRPTFTVAWAFRGLDQMHITAMADVLEKALVFCALILLVRGQGNDLLWVPVFEAGAALLIVLLLRKRLGRLYAGLRISFRYRDWPEVSRESLPLGMAALLGSLYLHGAILLLGWMDTSTSAADFLVAQKLMLTMTLLLHVINSSAFPSVSRLLSSDTSQALDLVSSLLRFYLVLIIPVIFVLAIFSDQIIRLLFGSGYPDSGPVLIILLATLPFLAINQSLLLILRTVPKPKTVLFGQIMSTVVLLIAATVLIPRFGAGGAAAAVVAGEVAGMVLLYWLTTRAVGTLPLNASCFSPLVAGALASLVYLFTNDWSLLVKLSLTVITYALALWALKAVTRDELRSVPHIVIGAMRKESTEQSPE